MKYCCATGVSARPNHGALHYTQPRVLLWWIFFSSCADCDFFLIPRVSYNESVFSLFVGNTHWTAIEWSQRCLAFCVKSRKKQVSHICLHPSSPSIIQNTLSKHIRLTLITKYMLPTHFLVQKIILFMVLFNLKINNRAMSILFQYLFK